MPAFSHLSGLTASSPGVFTTTLPERWEQGRAVFGGLVVATLARALESTAADRPLRSLTSELFAPAQPGPAELHVSVLREGNAVTTSSARLVQGGQAVAHAVGVLGRAREGAANVSALALSPPRPPAWTSVEAAPVEPPLGPVFAQHLEFRPLGAFPFSGEPHTRVEGWVRFKDPEPVRDAAWLAGLCDSHWPVMLTRETGPRPMSTIAFTLQPFVEHLAGLTADAFVFYRANLLAVDQGYCVEQRELWNEAGQLLALNQQTFVIIK